MGMKESKFRPDEDMRKYPMPRYLTTSQERPKARRATCPYCAKRVALTKTGKLYAHLDPVTGKRCVRRSPS